MFGTRRSNLRRAIGVGAALLTSGWIVGVIVAEACAVWMPVTPKFEANRIAMSGEFELRPSLEYMGGSLPLDPDPDPRYDRLEALADVEWLTMFRGGSERDRLAAVLTDGGPGLEFEVLIMVMHGRNRDVSSIRAVRAGWPWPCLMSWYWESEYNGEWPKHQGWHGVAPIPGMLKPGEGMSHAGRMPHDRSFPLLPIWSGMVLNSVFYAACLGGVVFGRGLIVRGLRRRAGRCVECGYNRAGLGVGSACPECGG